ncbi:hypothetical protein ACSTS3_11265 [Aquimarina muelleri]|uniref:glycosyl-4,4'-diaponeurosporenoate acyltransferase CrtO family protein n=1 Tax=Aquimarina muelleri TaxID=279356 RepID=UPI003F6861F7
MIIKYLTYSISITFISWMVGMIVNAFLSKKESYKKLSNLNLIKSETINKRIGLKAFKWIVKNTFFKYFNPKLKFKKKVEITDLNEIRKEMTFAEISHFIGFGFVTFFVVAKLIKGNIVFGLIFMIVNVVMNLYPSLLQQENKRRIDRLIKNYREHQ